jgi:hypothetical protein
LSPEKSVRIQRACGAKAEQRGKVSGEERRLQRMQAAGKVHSVAWGKNPKRTLYRTDKGKEENLSDKMRKKIDETKYRVLYGRRMQIIKPCFADMRYCKKMSWFTLRTKIKGNIQWLLYCIVHNIGKCMAKVAIESGG